MDRNDTTTLKLYSPLTAELQIEPIDDAYYDEPDMEQFHGSDLVYFREAILDGIAQEQLPGEAERGLMAYAPIKTAASFSRISPRTIPLKPIEWLRKSWM